VSGRSLRRGLLFLLIGSGLGAWVWYATRPEPLTVQVTRVARGRVERSVANTRAGSVRPCRRAALSPALGGQIARLPVHEGDHVQSGALLLELWNQDLVARRDLALRQVRVAEAKARGTCARADQAGREYRRLHRLLGRKLASEEAVDKARAAAEAGGADCAAAHASIEARQAEVALAQARIDKSRLLAPFSGVVAEVNGEVNEYATPSPPGIPTPPAIDLIDDRCFYIVAPIDEVDVGGIHPGLPVRISLDALGKRRFPGRVRRVSPYVQERRKQARTVEVEVDFDARERPHPLLAGYSADVEIVLESHEQALRIPTEALMEGDRVYVFLPAEGVVRQRSIETGLSNWDFTEVRKGLKAGDLVVTHLDLEGLAEGAPARIGNRPGP